MGHRACSTNRVRGGLFHSGEDVRETLPCISHRMVVPEERRQITLSTVHSSYFYHCQISTKDHNVSHKFISHKDSVALLYVYIYIYQKLSKTHI